MSAASVSYAEFQPAAPLNSLVECFWSLELAPGFEAIHHRAFPDGSVDIIVAPGGSIQVSGAMTRSTSWLVSPERKMTGARLRAGSAPAVLGISATEICDLVVPLNLLWRSPVRELADRLETETSHERRIRILGRFLAAAAEKSGKSAPSSVAHCVSRLSAPQTGPHFASLAAELGSSERQLRRTFEYYVGIGPKRFWRIMRFQRLLDGMRARDRTPWADVAQSYGYSDQSHLIREVREFAGEAPASLLRGVAHP